MTCLIHICGHVSMAAVIRPKKTSKSTQILLFSKVYSLNKKIKKVFFFRDECWSLIRACLSLYSSSTLVAQLTVLDEESHV